MKKLIAVLLLPVAAALAGMDDVNYSLSSVTTNQDSAAYVVRGSIEAINITVAATKTATVTVATSEGTVFSKSLTAATDGVFYPRVAAVDAAGNGASATNALVAKFVSAGALTCTVAPAADTTGTNDYSVKVIISK